MPLPIRHPFPFDPTHGFDQESLLRVGVPETEPAGFDDFWKRIHSASLDVPLDLLATAEDSTVPGFRLFKFSYRVLGGFRVSAWVTHPEDTSSIRTGMVVGHGYGGRDSIEPGVFKPGFLVILPVAPGFHISADPRLPLNDSSKHVLVGIESPQTYILGSCAAALWRAIDAGQEFLGRPLTRWHYHGWSFGGGMGALALPWETRFQSAELGQPTFGHHPLRLQRECTGSGEAVRLYHAAHPEVVKTLAFFDAATAATRIAIPTVFACSLFDPAVTPPGQFAVANAHPGPKRISPFLVGHFDYQYPEAKKEGEIHARNIEELIGADFVIKSAGP